MLVHGDDYLLTDPRSHGLVELVFAENQFFFHVLTVPRWINWPILRSV